LVVSRMRAAVNVRGLWMFFCRRWCLVLLLAGLVFGGVATPLASAHTDSVVVTFRIYPLFKAPLRIGQVASWRVVPDGGFDGCSVTTAYVDVTGSNPGRRGTQTWSGDGYHIGYTGVTQGVDQVTVSAQIDNCSNFGPYTSHYVDQTVFTLFWGPGARDHGGCLHRDPSKSPQAAAFDRLRCGDDPVDGGLGVPELGATDATLASPGVPFAFTRSYTAGDTSQGSLGYGWHSAYDARLLINSGVTPHTATALLATGQQIVFVQQPDGSWAAPSWTTSTLTYAAGVYTLAEADHVKWMFNGSNGYVTGIERNGQTLTVYTQFGTPVGVRTSNGITIWFTLDSSYRITQVPLPDGRHVSYSYDAAGNLATVTDLRGGVTSYTYDSAHRLLTDVDPNGHTVATNTYGSDGSIATQTDALGNMTSYARSSDYATGATTLVVTDPRGNHWGQTFTPEGRLASTTDPLNNTAHYTDDGNGTSPSAGNPVSYTDPAGNTVAYQYDGRSNLTQTTLPGSITTSATYNVGHDVLTSTNGRGATTSYSYDGNGNPTLITQPGGGTINLAYNAQGQLNGVTNQASKTTTQGYDSAGNLTSTTSPLGNKASYGYDSSGRLTSIVDPRGNVAGANPNDYKTTIAYNNADQVTGVTDPLGHTTSRTYDADGNLASRTDANGHTWQYSYDANNRVKTATAPDLTVTSDTYDTVGNLATRTDAKGHVTTYSYDAANRLTDIVDPLTRHWILGYDADSNLASVQTPSGGTISYGYTTLGQRSSVSYSDGTPTVSYSYDANGNRASMTDGAGTTNYTYNQLDQLTAATRGSDTFSYTYDAVGRVASRTYPDGTVASYTYNDDGSLATAVSGGNTTSYTYDAAGRLTQTSLPNTINQTTSHDHAGLLTQINDGFRTFAYGYDAAGNTTSRVIAGVTTTFTYDTLDRLTDINGTTSTNYGYDAVGNRTTQLDATGTTTSSYDAADQLQSVTAPGGTTNYSYDANGNETTAGTWSYTFNLADQLTSATNGAATTSYTYDGNGNRLSAAGGSTTTNYAWDTNSTLPQLAIETDSAGSLLRRYIYGVGRISMTTPSTTAYYSTDAIGSVTELSGAAGAVLGQYSQQPFGDSPTSSNVDPSVAGNPFGFAGEYQDPPTSLYNLRARNYDSTTSRFLSPDPLGPQDAANTYAYVANNPLRFIDPSGMKRGDTCGSVLCYLSSPKNFWTPLRYTADGWTCIEAGAVGAAVAGPAGFLVGCILVAGAFDTSAEQSKERILKLGDG
jgi:RHS repeat-associated protein